MDVIATVQCRLRFSSCSRSCRPRLRRTAHRCHKPGIGREHEQRMRRPPCASPEYRAELFPQVPNTRNGIYPEQHPNSAGDRLVRGTSRELLAVPLYSLSPNVLGDEGDGCVAGHFVNRRPLSYHSLYSTAWRRWSRDGRVGRGIRQLASRSATSPLGSNADSRERASRTCNASSPGSRRVPNPSGLNRLQGWRRLAASPGSGQGASCQVHEHVSSTRR